jgi:hypothetical protein
MQRELFAARVAVNRFDRAAHDLRGWVPARQVSQAGHLRAMARLIAVMGAVSRDQDTTAALHLIYTLTALAESLADLREAQDRLHQARAARYAAGQLRDYRPPDRQDRARPARGPLGSGYRTRCRRTGGAGNGSHDTGIGWRLRRRHGGPRRRQAAVRPLAR